MTGDGLPAGRRAGSGRRAGRRPGWGRRPGRRTGLALLAWGLAGLVLAAGSLLAVAGPLSTLGDLAAERATAVRWLDLADRSLVDAAASTRGAGDGLAAARTSTGSAAALFGDLAGAMGALSAASGISLLGSQPFAGAAAALGRVAQRSSELSAEMDDLGRSLQAEAGNLDRLAADVDELRTELAALRALAADDAPERVGAAARGLALLAVLMALWLAIPSAAAVAVGAHLARRAPRLLPDHHP